MIGGAAFIALLLFGIGVSAWNTRAGTLAEARRSIHQLGVALAEQTSRSMQGMDIVLQDTAGRLAAAADAGAAMATPEVHELLLQRLRSLPQADAIALVDAKGRVANSTRNYPATPIDVTDRDYFRHFQDGPAAETFISAPVRSRVSGLWTMFLARPLGAAAADADGAGFRGLVLGAISLDYIEQFYRAVTTKPGSSVALLRSDGIMLAQFPHEESGIGQVPPGRPGWDAVVRSGGGMMRSRGPDGLDRMVSVHLLPDRPLVVEVSVTEEAALAGWRRQTVAVALFSLLAAGCMALMLRKIARQFAAQRAARQSLAARNAELEQVRVRLEDRTRELADTAEALRGGERRLAEQSATLKTTLENIDQGVLMVDEKGIVAAYNHRAVEMLGLPEALLSRRPPFRDVVQLQWERGEFAKADGEAASLVGESGGLDQPHLSERQRPDGRTIEVHSLPLPGGGAVRTYTDITDRKTASARVHYTAHNDQLTGLASRVALQERLEEALRTRPADLGVAVLFLDLDRFRLINDARGHEVGDRLLVEVAKRIKAMVRDADLVARMGGDEFAIVQATVAQQEEATALAGRLVDRLAEPYVINGVRLTIGVSIGIAISDAGSSADTLRRNADIAMYRAKDGGRNTYCLYEPAMAAMQQEQFLLEQALREALGSQDFQLAYQPIISVANKAVVGYEALLRWTHPTRGAVAPQEFVPLAEATGLIVPLGRWVLNTACHEAASWPNTCRIAVNLSPVQFRQGDLLAVVEGCLKSSGLSPDRLELEVTEGVLLEDTGNVLETMVALRRAGVSITLDDFGTGHAGLSYLRRFPFDKIKIDKSFVRNLGHDKHSDAIVEAILLLGRRLDLRVVAEGVEEEAQLALLREMRCPLVQGYLTGPPMPAELARAL